MEIILFVLGAFLSWVVSHVYYRKSERDQARIYSKLSAEVRETILQDKRESLSVQDLNELLEKKTVGKNRNEPLPYVACPKCGSKKLKKGELFDEKRDENYYVVQCESCEWQDWTQ